MFKSKMAHQLYSALSHAPAEFLVVPEGRRMIAKCARKIKAVHGRQEARLFCLNVRAMELFDRVIG